MTSFISPFAQTLHAHGLHLAREQTKTLQVNVGLLCNLRCRHCHLEAGPQRREVMAPATMEAVVAYAARAGFATIDLTGGAPELVPGLADFLTRLAPLCEKLIVRTNLVALETPEAVGLVDLFRELRVALVASLPSTNAAQADSQRGQGVWKRSIAMLKILNTHGYGQPHTGLTLDLAVNPAGAFLPADQKPTELRYRRELAKQGIAFSSLFTFTNVPLGRFRRWLEQSGNLPGYLQMLAARFNPCAVSGVMCRSLVSVSWQGFLYDCDFNLALDLPLGGTRRHVTEMSGPPEPGIAVVTGEHCYACTAGAGFT